ncbi:MAG: hypothetical protein IJ468_14965 [Lachnospiraceae bacterium]|nr:hypothetical protein [Lachnospiraceae bacterium]
MEAIKITFPSGERCVTRYGALQQYDYGQKLEISGLDLPTTVRVDFSTERNGGVAYSTTGTTANGVTTVEIPDYMLQNNDVDWDYTVYVYFFVIDEEAGRVEYRINLEVIARSKPETVAPPDAEPDYFNQAITEVNSAAERAEAAEQSAADILEQVSADGADQVQKIRETGDEVLGSIPDDYETAAANARKAVREKAPAIVCEMSGAVCVATDASEDYVRGLTVFGRTEQKTTTGKNLLKNTATSQTKNGVTFTVNEDKSVTVNGTATADVGFVINSNVALTAGQYILSGITGGSSSTYLLYLTTAISGGTIIAINAEREVNFTLEESMENVIARIIVKSGVTVSNLVFKPMIRLAEVADSTYEPYTGGIASPNPEYPQELTPMGDWGNLFDISTVTNGFNINGAGEIIVNESYIVSDFVSASGGIIYTSAENQNYSAPVSTYSRCAGYDENKNFVCLVYESERTEVKRYSKTFTVPDGVKYIRFSYRNTDTDIMVNIGSTALPYRPYTGEREIGVSVLGSNLYNVAKYTGSGASVDADGWYTISLDNTNGTANLYKDVNIPASELLEENKEYAIICEIASISNMVVQVATTTETSNKGQFATYYGLSEKGTFVKLLKTRESLDGCVTILRTFLVLSAGLSGSAKFRISVLADTTVTAGSFVYAPYTHKSLITPVGSGLHGIPVTDASLATYTDENGQMWCADYVDWEAGELVQRVKLYSLVDYMSYIRLNDNTEYSADILRFDFSYIFTCQTFSLVLCNRFMHNFAHGNNSSDVRATECISSHPTDDIVSVFINKNRLETADIEGFKTFLKNNETLIVVVLATPIRTKLSTEEMITYNALHTNKLTTTIMNDCNAHMKVSYNADTKTYVNTKIAEVCAAILNQ